MMKRFSILFIVALVFAGISNYEASAITSPPTSSWALSATQGDYGTILLKPTSYGGTYTVNGRAMAAGDAIGAFYYDGTTRKCAGYMVWQGTDNTNNFAIVVWENDTLTTGVKEGFNPGETINLIMWDNVLQEEAPVTSTTCNTNGIPSINYPAVGPCQTTFSGNMIFMYDAMAGQAAPSGFTLSGTVKYANTAQTAMNNCTVKLKDASNTVVATTTTNTAGEYSFSGVANGNYTLEITTTKAWGGVNVADMLQLRTRLSTGASYLNAIKTKAADVNSSGTINVADALQFRQKLSGGAATGWTAPNYVFDPVGVTINGAGQILNVLSLCSGDINGSYNPPVN